jgi:hypothetical protein
MTIAQGQVELERILREVAEEQKVEIDHVHWSTLLGEDPPTHRLEIYDPADTRYSQEFTRDHLTELDTDNDMKLQVRMKIESIILKHKQYGR